MPKGSKASISVVIPSFNDGHLLEPCLRSIGSQSLTPLEVIIVDDGSTSATAQAGLREALEVHPNVRIIRQANRGPSAARNRGLGECRSPFVAFVDADDALRPDNLEVRLKMFDVAPEAIGSFGGYLARWPDGREKQSTWRSYHGALRNELIGRPGGVPGGLHQYLLKTEALRAIGGLDSSLEIMEDFDALIRLGRAGQIFIGCNDPIYIRNMRGDSLSRASASRSLRGSLRFLAKARHGRYFNRTELGRRYVEAFSAWLLNQGGFLPRRR